MANHAFRMASPERAIYRAGSLTLSLGCMQRAMYLTLKGLFCTRPFGPKCHLIESMHRFSQPHLNTHRQTYKPPDMHPDYMRVIFVEGCDPPRK